ncbi:MAG: hypothetical protein MUE85_16635 [Microscillaceae bacterium]|jgi:hypothetical protein|nr:hypothetical protein [Microscillaceae bacterium]
MEKIAETQYLEIFFAPEYHTLVYRWFGNNSLMQDEEYQAEMLYVQALGFEHRPNTLVANMLKSQYAVSLPMQAWVNTEVMPEAVKNGLKQIFLVMSQDFIQQISIEQVIEGYPQGLKVKFFQTEKEIWDYLKTTPDTHS